MHRKAKSISWLELLIIDLALILAIGAMGATKAAQEATDAPAQSVASVPMPTALASR